MVSKSHGVRLQLLQCLVLPSQLSSRPRKGQGDDEMNFQIAKVGSVVLHSFDGRNVCCTVEILNTDGNSLFSISTGGSSEGSLGIYRDVSIFFQSVGFSVEAAVKQAEDAERLLENCLAAWKLRKSMK